MERRYLKLMYDEMLLSSQNFLPDMATATEVAEKTEKEAAEKEAAEARARIIQKELRLILTGATVAVEDRDKMKLLRQLSKAMARASEWNP